MGFNFTGIKANLEGIKKYLNANGVNLSANESKQLESIFTQTDIDKNLHANCESDKGNNLIDHSEVPFFINLLETKLPNIAEKTASFFVDLNDSVNEGFQKLLDEGERHIKKLEKKESEAKTDAIKNYKPQVEKDIKITKTVPAKTMPIETKITAQHKVIASGDIVYNEKLMNQALNNLIKNNSKLKDKAAAFVKSAQKDALANKLDPFVLIAISMHESANGVSKASLQKNNIGGIMGKRGLRKFDNVESCIDSIANTVNTRVSEGRKTISSIGYSGKYCAKSEAPRWIKQVTKMAERLRQEYNKLLEQNYKN